MTQSPYPTRPVWATIVDVLIVLVALALTLWTLLDDTLPAWLIRLSVGAAIVAAVALTLAALHRLSGRP